MQITILHQETSRSFHIEISRDLKLADLKAYIEAEADIPAEAQKLIHDNRLLIDGDATLVQLEIADKGLILLFEDFDHKFTGSSHIVPHIIDSAKIRPNIDLPPRSAERNRTKAESSGYKYMGNESNHLLKMVKNNADDPESQAKILETIRQNQVEENLQLAFDIAPESFVAVNLLYVKLRINKHETYALVDTGAQTTVIHPKLAQKFGILNLIDGRFASMSVGVGSQRSEGRIHSVPVSLGDLNIEIPCSFTVLNIHVGILFGLDMLRRHKCNVDLATDVLVIGDRKIKFLTDYEIEKHVLPSQIENELSQKNQLSISRSGRSSMELSAPRDHTDSRNSDTTSPFPEASVLKVMSLGFTRNELIEALRLAKGNVELAASSLF